MNEETRCGAVIVAAGSSSRMPGQDKVTVDLAGKPVLAWSVDACERCTAIRAVALVVRADQLDWARALVVARGWRKVTAICAGGTRRQDSVERGVAALEGSAWVAVHDAARPFAAADLFTRCLESARQHGGCSLAATRINDTVKRVGGVTVAATLPREDLWSAQTPQVCHRSTLEQGLGRANAEGWTVTDEAMLFERLGQPVTVVESADPNFKLTTPADLQLARLVALAGLGAGGWGLGPVEASRVASEGTGTLLEDREPVVLSSPAPNPRPLAPRVGIGYDVHRLAAGRRLVLGGVTLAHERGLEGHSDADVLLHAIMDALLGAAALGDIGRHFPPSDPAYHGADSRALLRQVRAKLKSAGYVTSNVDATVIAERPKLGPHIATMRACIAADLEVSVDCISVKATTNEGLGPEGREEGISAFAVAMVGSDEE